jgi:SPX domain protein involved in polyphosphate accumulation
MKFGKRIGNEAEAAGVRWQRYFVDYKFLKKLLKRLASEASAGHQSLDAEEEAFRRSIFSEIDKVRATLHEALAASCRKERAEARPNRQRGDALLVMWQVDHFFAHEEAELYTQ